ncbi:MAG: hypothetical protein JO001_03340 [Alphaproteobacteria bacterium]|nr:hypothetical protein [Alphaproteobacteria bacterium]
MKAWRLVALVLIILLGGIVARTGRSTPDDTAAMIDHNCALFYGSLGPEAEHDCEVQMRRRHNLSTSE